MNKLMVLIIVILSINNVVSAQECGPSCPICSGRTDGSLLSTGSFLFSGIIIPGGEEETGVLNFRYGAFSRIDLGAGYALKSEESSLLSKSPYGTCGCDNNIANRDNYQESWCLSLSKKAPEEKSREFDF